MNETDLNVLLASVSPSEVDALLARYGYPEPALSRCRQCAATEYEPRAVACYSCEGVGEVYRVGSKVFPASSAGYVEAAKAVVQQMRKDEHRGR